MEIEKNKINKRLKQDNDGKIVISDTYVHNLQNIETFKFNLSLSCLFFS